MSNIDNLKKQVIDQKKGAMSAPPAKKPPFAFKPKKKKGFAETYADLPRIRKEEKALEAKQKTESGPAKKADRAKELRDEAIIKRLVTPKGK